MFFISDRSMLEHRCPWDTYHIEVPERLATVLKVSEEPEISKSLQHLKPRSATEEEMEMVHTKQYISEVKRTRGMKEEELEEFSSNYEDIYVNMRTFDNALLATGCVFQLVDAVGRTGTPGFAAVRPPGHHAFPDRGCGFCIFNNVALAAKYALRKGHSRVLIVDWDVHAGQGTQECISDDDRIRLVSIHRFQRGHFWPNLQQSAVKTKFKNTINVPLNDIGMCDSDYLAIFQLVVHPIINDFKPDIILVSCGFDAALGDPEGEMRVTPAGYATLTHQLLTWRIPLLMVLEGGYFLDSVAMDFKWVAKALLGHEIPAMPLQVRLLRVWNLNQQYHYLLSSPSMQHFLP
ncbi:histone deacetylase family protein [Ancylostoma duodenale]|uniref:Histone deacetylase family protein n=1 Tax=Ancylostoma duodenale TaxID=51022 RepID=A0A0C2GYT2_9BILA|nr:histone deacetylase family protein [Ancylostoma duodenale]